MKQVALQVELALVQELDLIAHLLQAFHACLEVRRQQAKRALLARSRQKRLRAIQKLGVGQTLDVLAIHPIELVDVEDRTDETEALHVEVGHHVVERKDFPPVRHAPALQGEEVHQRLGQKAFFLEPQQTRRRVLALADLRSIPIAQQRKVGKRGRLPAEELIQQQLFG